MVRLDVLHYCPEAVCIGFLLKVVAQQIVDKDDDDECFDEI